MDRDVEQSRGLNLVSWQSFCLFSQTRVLQGFVLLSPTGVDYTTSINIELSLSVSLPSESYVGPFLLFTVKFFLLGKGSGLLRASG